ncbi:MAG: TOBE domain-containing protein [Candidatus Omnitrophica bacterium]|nr:TOBE domain-containing protein [Candidatus Omnitrophota bacterium]
MNKLTGQVTLIESSEHMSIVDIDVDGDIFSAIVLETPASAAYLKQGGRVTMLFKETEVSIGKNLSGLVSLRNRFKGTIKLLEKSDILTKVILDYKTKEIISIITTRSAQKLGLIIGDAVEWLVKTNEVFLLKER